jgi:hypothetical protein
MALAAASLTQGAAPRLQDVPFRDDTRQHREGDDEATLAGSNTVGEVSVVIVIFTFGLDYNGRLSRRKLTLDCLAFRSVLL